MNVAVNKQDMQGLRLLMAERRVVCQKVPNFV